MDKILNKRTWFKFLLTEMISIDLQNAFDTLNHELQLKNVLSWTVNQLAWILTFH